MDVAVVPMFEPNVSGYILSMDTTPIPTSGVIADVKTELDWTRIVIPAPMRMATYPVRNPNGFGKSEFRVLRMTLAIFPE